MAVHPLMAGQLMGCTSHASLQFVSMKHNVSGGDESLLLRSKVTLSAFEKVLSYLDGV